MSSDLNHSDELPETLAAELRTLYGTPRTAVPPAVDAGILAEARAGFARRRRFMLARRAAVAVTGLAAAAAVVVIALRPAIPPSHPSVQHLSIVTSPEDVDHSGKVDILDAFVVARLIEVQGQLDKTHDVNSDGKVDQADVDQIASVAVAVVPNARVQ